MTPTRRFARSVQAAFLSASCCCATAPAPAPATPAVIATKPTARSSIGAVLSRSAELSLTDEQVGRLRDREDQLLRATPAHVDPPQQSTVPTTPQSDVPRGGGGRMGMGGGRHRDRSGGSDPPSKPETPEHASDERDAEAYMEAEEMLTETQRPRARELASQYREQLYNWREAVRQHRTASGASDAH